MNNLANDRTQTMLAYSFNQEIGKKELADINLLHDYPLSIVDHSWIQEIFKHNVTIIQDSTENTIKNEIKIIYKEEKRQLTKLIEKNGSRVRITTNMWPASNQKRGYMIVASYFVD